MSCNGTSTYKYEYHVGTKQSFVVSIIENGLRPSRGGLLGPGIDLADCSQKSDRYADYCDECITTGLTILVVRTALGVVDAYDADRHGGDHLKTYDSLTGGLGIPPGTSYRFREFIVPSEDQCCIEYIVHYHRE